MASYSGKMDDKTVMIRKKLMTAYGLNALHLTAKDAQMGTLPQHAFLRDMVLDEAFEGLSTLNVLDVFANVCIDSMSLAAASNRAKRPTLLLSIEGDKGCYKRLDLNSKLYVESAENKFVTMGVRNIEPCDYITDELLGTFEEDRLDLLYLAPPWDLPKNFIVGRASDAATNAVTVRLVNLLEAMVFFPLGSIQYPHPRLICIKAPVDYETFSAVLFDTSFLYLGDYELYKTASVNNSQGAVCMYFHFLHIKHDGQHDEQQAMSQQVPAQRGRGRRQNGNQRAVPQQSGQNEGPAQRGRGRRQNGNQRAVSQQSGQDGGSAQRGRGRGRAWRWATHGVPSDEPVELGYSGAAQGMMKRMGHVDGTGLGPRGDGRVAPVDAERRGGMGIGFERDDDGSEVDFGESSGDEGQ
jgi:hypothetical protein